MESSDSRSFLMGTNPVSRWLLSHMDLEGKCHTYLLGPAMIISLPASLTFP